ncbi:MAG: TerB family tellurite resistance protein [Deltaproteobacteria bacterium]|nr:TerB family tellurite resistance protein [Deltaproteobacteria bacterium]
MPIVIPPEQAKVALRALKTIAAASKGIDETERELLEAAANALHVDEDLDALATITPEEAARAITDEKNRTRLVEGMMLMAMMDQDIDAEEVKVIRRFADVFGIDEPRVKNLAQFVQGDHVRLKLDVFRRSYFLDVAAVDAWKNGGFKGLWKAFAPRAGLATDPELAWRYKQLGLLPESTLGRAYWAHMTRRKLSFPGEPHGFPWQVVHDIGHVLGDYGTDPSGEIEQAAFEAGYMKRDPFFLVFATTMIFHMGFDVLGDDYIGHAKGQFRPASVVRAYERGLACKVDLTTWDPWPHVERPLAEVRTHLGIPPKS